MGNNPKGQGKVQHKVDSNFLNSDDEDENRIDPKDYPKLPENLEQKYEVGEEIGRGAFSQVHVGKNKKTGEKVGIKFIGKKWADADDLKLLDREIAIMKKMNNPHVMGLHEYFETSEVIALVMDFLDGGELFYKIIEKGNYSEKDAANIIVQIVTGVRYLHEHGVCHRDLKPENVLCSNTKGFEPFRVVIADFGLSKIFDDENKLQTRCGTPDYVAPEVIAAEGSYDKGVDMWAVGVISYVLLCGFSPFVSNTDSGLFALILRAKYDFPSPEWDDISTEAKDFVRKLLLPDPLKRLTSQQALEHPWLKELHKKNESLNKIASKIQDYNKTRKLSIQNFAKESEKEQEERLKRRKEEREKRKQEREAEDKEFEEKRREKNQTKIEKK